MKTKPENFSCLTGTVLSSAGAPGLNTVVERRGAGGTAEVAIDTRIITLKGAERVIRYAYETARHRARGAAGPGRGFDARLLASGTFDYKNPVWEVDGLRHLVEPKLSYRYAPEAAAGNDHFSHFGSGANLFEELETLFCQYGNEGSGRIRK